MSAYTEAVDATLDVTAELARVTAELATLKAGIKQLENPMAVRVSIYRGTIAKPWPEPHEVWAQAADRAKENEAEIERLKGIIADQARDESGRVSMPLAAHNKIDAARRQRDEAVARAENAESERDELRSKLERVPPNMGNAVNQIDVLVRQRDTAMARAEKAEAERDEWRAEALQALKVANELTLETQTVKDAVTDPVRIALMHLARAEKAEKANAALRKAAKWALTHIEVVARTGHVSTGGEQNGNRQCFEWARDKISAALADPNLGADWVSGADLRRVAEAVREACAVLVCREAVDDGLDEDEALSLRDAVRRDVDLDAIARVTR